MKLTASLRTAAASLAIAAGIAASHFAGAAEPIKLRVYVVSFVPVVLGGDGGPLNQMAAEGLTRDILAGSPESLIDALHKGNISTRLSTGFDVPVPTPALTAGVSASGSFDLARGSELYQGSFEQIEGGKKLHFHAIYRDAPADRVVDGDMTASPAGVFVAQLKDAKFQAAHGEETFLLVARPVAGAGR